MEGSVKERLTGALIFVAAFSIFVPQILSGPRSKVAGAAVAQPADAGPPLLTYSMDLRNSADPQEAVEAASAAPAPAPVVEPAPASAPEVSTPADSSPAAAQSAAATQSPAARQQPAAVASTSPKGMWWAQIETFSVRENAERLARQLRAAGFTIDVSKVNARGKDLYRVRAGPVRDRTEALVLQSRLMANGNKSLLVAP